MMERAFVPRGRLAQDTWHRPLARAGTGGWLAAAAYESGVRYPWTHAGQAVFAAVVTYALQMPFMLLIGLAPLLSERGMRLTGGLLYPLSRPERAQLGFRGALLDALTLYAFAAAAMWLLTAAGVPAFGWFAEEMKPVSLPATLGFGVALAPLMQFQGIRSQARGQRQMMRLPYFASAVGYLLGAQGAAIAATRVGLASQPMMLLLAVVTVGVAAQLVHRALLRRTFMLGDTG
jgi:hypothetical protein